MANTTIQLKYSTVTTAPTTLNVAEPAYSYVSNTLFIGTPGSDGVIAVGGQFYTNQQGLIFTKTNVAFDTANSAASYANAAFASSNNNAGAATAGSYANSAFGVANSAASYANSAFGLGNSAFAVSNSAASYANSGFAVANSSASYANSAFLTANNTAGVNLTQNTNISSAASYANSAFLQANTPSYTANSAAAYANGAFAAANTKLSSSGGTITGDLSITGNLVVSGNTTYVDTEILTVEDSLIKLANNNTAGDTVDIGFYGMYKPATGAVNYTGLARTAGANTYFLFRGLTNDPTTNALASGSVTASNTATLIANVQAYSITINSVDVETNQNRIFTQANSAYATANSAGSYANSAFLAANTPSHVANSAASYANSAFIVANNSLGIDLTQNTNISSAASYANSAFAAANTADAKGTSAGSYANSGFAVANSAAGYANSAFAKANTDVTTISVSGGYFGNGATIASFTLEANGRISQANSTLIGISASQVTVGTLPVARGGTGAGSFTTNGVLLGQGTSALTTASSSTEGHVLTINNSGVPTFAHLSGGTF